MQRRQLLKSIGLLSIAGASVTLLAGCEEKTKEEEVVKEETPKPELSEREKLLVNRKKMAIQDAENPTELELKHTPAIEVKEEDGKGFTRVDVTIGSKGIIHPTEANHWIDYIKLYLDEKLIASVENEIGAARGFSSFYVKLEGVSSIKAEAGCNLHGIWENTINI